MSLLQVRDALREDPVGWLKAHAELPVVPIRERPGCEELPDSLVQNLERALAKDPEARPPDAGAFANILGMILHRDMGIPVAATLRVLDPDGNLDDRLFLPGSYHLGHGPRSEIKLNHDSILKLHAILEWSGMPNRPHLRPVAGDGSVKVNDQPIRHPVELQEGDEFSVGAYRLAVAF